MTKEIICAILKYMGHAKYMREVESWEEATYQKQQSWKLLKLLGILKSVVSYFMMKEYI